VNILATQYTLLRKSLEIYVAGCKGNNGVHCTSCHNPESWEFNQGRIYNEFYFNKIKTKIDDFNDMINKIEIFGGEINDQNHEELEVFLKDLKSLDKEIWLFTRYDLKDCPRFELELCDYIKCGAYIPELSCNNNLQYGITLATSNQKIYKKGLDY
jgi:anaerobic ribonucleoside-triphosphate reductase activating protein